MYNLETHLSLYRSPEQPCF